MGCLTCPGAVYVGNYEYDASERELERTFDKYGPVERVEYKSGFCFVHYKDKRDAEDAIHALDGREWGRLRRRLRVEFAKNDANVREREKARRNSADPNRTLFVAGFDPRGIRTRDIEKAFEEFGRLVRCEIKKTFSFVEFERIEDAKEACEQLHGSRINGREITVEYDRGGRGGGDDRYRGRSRSRSMERRRHSPSYDRSRSPRPVRRSPSPLRRSPSPDRCLAPARAHMLGSSSFRRACCIALPPASCRPAGRPAVVALLWLRPAAPTCLACRALC
ncbi:hypothetical protein CHLNCDRAFT_25380 [Chlorella variabilis]|uniref:RRM domain-containing protein n=1 Tax=Chlorella variabilis TaxID=554065 RepID=E1ZJY1_CHLVA|nr:hypothetical protein CHLNCDRAFT_25380 [Chlorella variabilis]EFN53940.1 hypothetical protein CHLNCDRAFT_25380 [Chlorella variabilis]|eukprot:XP_005846042.1 hypothetical protein CHLNCDRAFT_25380 [Chlorella variabilis]